MQHSVKAYYSNPRVFSIGLCVINMSEHPEFDHQSTDRVRSTITVIRGTQLAV